jgi:4-phosphopantoate--beta-alanine ligase
VYFSPSKLLATTFMTNDLPLDHPRYQAMLVRHRLEEGVREGLVAPAGLLAHGRGEAFDYLLGEKTPELSTKAIEVACALLLIAKRPVISVNGNAAVLAPAELVALAKTVPTRLEVNVFYGRTQERETKLAALLQAHGAEEVLGVNPDSKIPLLSSARGRVAKEGIFAADVVLVMLEDGDRTEALIAAGKKVIAIDLNPLSRTPQKATVAIVDNLLRCVPLMIATVERLREFSPERLQELVESFDNGAYLRDITAYVGERLRVK